MRVSAASQLRLGDSPWAVSRRFAAPLRRGAFADSPMEPPVRMGSRRPLIPGAPASGMPSNSVIFAADVLRPLSVAMSASGVYRFQGIERQRITQSRHDDAVRQHGPCVWRHVLHGEMTLMARVCPAPGCVAVAQAYGLARVATNPEGCRGYPLSDRISSAQSALLRPISRSAPAAAANLRMVCMVWRHTHRISLVHRPDHRRAGPSQAVASRSTG